MYRVILFDLDGTLTDSAEGITKSVQFAIGKMGRQEPPLEELNQFLGPPLKEEFMKYCNISEPEARKAVEYYRERYNLVGIFENHPYDGVLEMLQSLKEQGYILGVASSKPEYYVEKILKHFGMYQYFAVVTGSEMNGSRTKKADVIEEALRRIGYENRRKEVVMVGDREYDVLGARAMGLDCIAVSYGYGSWEELNAVSPAAVAAAPAELLDFFS